MTSSQSQQAGQSEQRFDLAVIGLGLIGSGALRHAALADVGSVIGIGPGEPADWGSHAGPFASHYDSGRITRRLDAKREWAILADRSIEQYPIIEAASGIRFHNPCGLMFVRNDEAGIANQTAVARELDIPITIEPSEVRSRSLPQLRFPDGYTTLREPAPAGAIDPRKLVDAQLAAAGSAGADVVHDVAENIESFDGGYRIDLVNGAQPIEAERLLISAGSYGNSLLPTATVAAAVRPEAIVKGEVSEETARRLDIPSFIYLLDNPFLDDVYVVPPTQYPDGRWYIKIGGSRAGAANIHDPSHMAAWMQGNDPDNHADQQIDAMRDVLTAVLPEVEFLSWSAKPCLITDTINDLPFVDIVAPGLTIAFGGNGHAAKSSDAIGALAAALALTGSWTDPDLDASQFRAQVGAYQPPDGSRHGN